MAWFWLITAIVAEVAGTLTLKQSAGLTRLWPSLAVLVSYTASFVLLGQALRSFDVGTAYALWSGLGTALIVFAGTALFGESLGTGKILGVGLIISGVATLHLAGAD